MAATPANSTRLGAWSAVWSMTMGVAALIIAEFLPVGVLTPMARELGISEGMAGQAVTATSVFAVITSLLVAYVTRKLNRRQVLLALTFLLASSSLIVAVSSSFAMLLAGRVLLGISLGGFWSMATAVTIRLVPEQQVPKALALIFGGSSFASVFAAPLGSFLSGVVGWRSAFFFATATGVAAFVWQFVALPQLSPTGNVRLRTTLDVLRAPQFTPGLLAILFVFGGRFASFTYMRPFLERTTHVGVNWISVILLVYGLAYFAGNLFSARMIQRNLRRALFAPPLVLAVITVGILLFGHLLLPTVLLVFVWGACFAPIAPAWSTWVAKRVPEQAETGGGLYVAAVQLSAVMGASLGGVVFDSVGSNGVFTLSGAAWLVSAAVVLLKVRAPMASPVPHPGAQPAC